MPETIIDVEVAYATAEQQTIVALKLPDGCTVASAIEASDLLSRFPEISQTKLNVGVFARTCELTQLLKQGDRVEIYRHLRNDPKEARRQRAIKK